MATVHTDFGPGEIIASETVRGRTQHKVAVHGVGEIWVDEAKLGNTRMADAFAWTPPGHHPDAPSDSFSHLGDEDPYYEPHRHEDMGWSPEDISRLKGQQDEYSGFGDELGGALSPEVHENPGYNHHAPGYDPHRDYTQWEDGGMGHLGWAPVDHDNSVNLPYDPTPQYPAIPGDTESTLQPIHEIDADERLSPADSITFEDRAEDESDLEPTGPNFENAHTGAIGDPTPHQTGPYGLDHNAPELREYAHPDFQDDDYAGDIPGEEPQGVHPRTGKPFPPGIGYDDYHGNFSFNYPEGHYMNGSVQDLPGHMANTAHEGFAFLLPLAEGLMGAGAGAAAGGAAADAGVGAVGQGLARGVGSAATHEMMGGGDEASGQQPGAVDKALDWAAPGPGWDDDPSQYTGAVNHWLASREVKAENIGAGLSDRYIDITADVDYHNDPVAQFRHDPMGYIARVGHVHDEAISSDMEHYGQLVEANASIREAAWADVRAKAMRLRREGRVHVKDVDTDRIYASVDGDNGTYDVMIAKGGAYGGFGGGHTITNWRCACEWGRWAFKRQLTYVGRLCSHGYAAYMEMQSAHMKGKERHPKLPRYKRADALQNEPQRLVPELVVNSEDDSRIFPEIVDVTKDERKDVGPDDIVSDQDIVHFARVMDACERDQLPYPRELVAFLERLGEDQTEEDWKVQDAGSAAGSALNEIRDWAETPQAEDYGHMEERNDDIRDAVDKARDGGTDASQLVAFRTAAPADESLFGGDYTPVRDAPSAPSGSREPEGSGPHQFPAPIGSGTAEVSQGVAGAGTPSAPGNVSATPDAPAAPAGPSMFGPAVNPGAPAGPSMFGPSGGGQPASPAAPGAGQPGTQGLIGPAAGGAAPSGPSLIGPGAQAPQPGGGSNSIGQGQYQVQSGDTLSDIAQRSGYGGDYNSLAQQNNIADPNHIETGQSINIGKPGGGGGQGGSSSSGSGGSGGKAPQATDSPSTNAPGGPLNQNSGGPGADINSPENTNPGLNNPAAPASNPAQTGSNPATPQNTPQVDLGATGGSSGGSGGVDTSAVPGGGGGATDTSSENSGAGSPTSDSGGGGGTQDSNSGASSGQNTADAMSTVGDIAGQVGDIASKFLGSVFADQGDYDEWQRLAYPEIGPGSHQPFAGSGPLPSLEFSTSEEYADKARKDHDDVTDLKDHNVVEASSGGGGIRRAGKGPQRSVVPTVIREQKVRNGRVVEAAHEPDDFDPYSRTASSFEDPYADVESAAVHTAASGGDFVADFQRNFGAAIMSGASGGGGGGQYDDFASSPAVREAMRRTAGRNYSLAEQAELIREGDVGGAGNLDQLQLAGTHYDESKNSVGLW